MKYDYNPLKTGSQRELGSVGTSSPRAGVPGPLASRESAQHPFLFQKQLDVMAANTAARAGACALVCHPLARIPGHVTISDSVSSSVKYG